MEELQDLGTLLGVSGVAKNTYETFFHCVVWACHKVLQPLLTLGSKIIEKKKKSTLQNQQELFTLRLLCQFCWPNISQGRQFSGPVPADKICHIWRTLIDLLDSRPGGNLSRTPSQSWSDRAKYIRKLIQYKSWNKTGVKVIAQRSLSPQIKTLAHLCKAQMCPHDVPCGWIH